MTALELPVKVGSEAKAAPVVLSYFTLFLVANVPCVESSSKRCHLAPSKRNSLLSTKTKSPLAAVLLEPLIEIVVVVAPSVSAVVVTPIRRTPLSIASNDSISLRAQESLMS